MKWLTRKKNTQVAKSALEEARDPENNPGATQKLVQQILNIGIDGKAGYPGAVEMAEKQLAKAKSREDAEDRIVLSAIRSSTGLGFITNLGGFVTMPIAIPANLVEFYVTAIRAVAGIAHLRGYDVNSDEVRTAALLSLTGSNAEDILKKAGVVNLPASTVQALLRSRLPKPVLMMVNKAVGFRLMRSVGEKLFARLGRAIPFAGGIIGGGLDAYMMRQILRSTRKDFPVLAAPTNPTV
ncbi:MAG: EcsC family protein [Propionibacteriaceae bacterium]